MKRFMQSYHGIKFSHSVTVVMMKCLAWDKVKLDANFQIHQQRLEALLWLQDARRPHEDHPGNYPFPVLLVVFVVFSVE